MVVCISSVPDGPNRGQGVQRQHEEDHLDVQQGRREVRQT